MKTKGEKQTSARRETRTASVPATHLSQPLDAHVQTRQVASRPAPSRSIEIHINQLVLHGFAHSDRRPIADSIERELRTLLANEDFLNASSLTVDQISGGSFQLENTRRNESAGANIARAIHGGLRR